MTVAAILKHKGNEVVSTTEDTSIATLVRLLVDRRIGAVPVMNEAGLLAGIISERDVMGALGAHGAAALEMRVGHLMIKIPPTGTPATTVEEAMEIMTHQRFRHLPILDEGKLIGIISIGDVVKARMMQQAQEVDSLKAYVVA